MPSKNLTIRLSEKNRSIIGQLLTLNRHNFYPVDINTRNKLINLLITTTGQQLLDAAHEGRNFKQATTNRLTLSVKDLNALRLVHRNTKRLLYMITVLLTGTMENGWTEHADDYLQSFRKDTNARKVLALIDQQLNNDEKDFHKKRKTNTKVQQLTDA